MFIYHPHLTSTHFNPLQPTVIRKFHSLQTSTNVGRIFFRKIFSGKLFFRKFLSWKFFYWKFFLEVFFWKFVFDFFFKNFFWKIFSETFLEIFYFEKDFSKKNFEKNFSESNFFGKKFSKKILKIFCRKFNQSQPTSPYFIPFQSTSSIYRPLFTTERDRP